MENSSFGFQFGTFGAGLYGGMWGFPKDLLDAYRRAVADDVLGAELEEVIASVQDAGCEISPDAYKRVPSGYDANHPRAELLTYKGLHASSPQFDVQLVTTPEIVDVCFEQCQKMAPLQRWLARLDLSV